MTVYNPDKWMIIRMIDNGGTHYRVFGSWYGGYLGSDSWRMNSGITKVEIEDDYYLFSGSSGSVYRCHKDMYGASLYGHSIIKHYSETNPELFVPLYEQPEVETLL